MSATSGPAPRDASAAPGRPNVGYPSGHLGHLTADEEAALQAFKASLAGKGYYRPGPPRSHEDGTLLRFLRARRWVVQDAFKQFKDTEDWRATNGLGALYDTLDVAAYEECRGLYPQWTGRADKRGIPIYLFEIRNLDSKTIQAYEKSTEAYFGAATSKPAEATTMTTPTPTPPKLLRLFALYENLTRFVHPLFTQLPDRPHARTTPITLSTNIVDVSGVSLRQFWNLKGHMQAASQLATAHYPETLDCIFVIGAPAFFTTVWGWVKHWFDPVTVSKIFILAPAQVRPTLETFMHPADIPRQYGGSLDFVWGGPANLGPALRDRIAWEPGHAAFPKGPLYWRELDGGTRLECVAVGSVDKVRRMERVCTIPVIFPAREEQQQQQQQQQRQQVTEAAVGTVPEATANAVAEVDNVQPVQKLSLTDKDVLETKSVAEPTAMAPVRA
ncbi:hypothetical protein P8C59_000839 [Phyllachora maydis]|uniref:CRAL-TRIO domain-containing protein n=1 Tax=Phyllachora maydis TaxID=1825666 RepID=A0AAD9HWZ0_9PEZI|nr:hypothetical protein P8C59_000839 [Phyllachora maydis]